MMNLDKLIKYALSNNKTITDHLKKTPEGHPLIQVNRSPNAIYPLIEFHQIAGGDVNYADEEVFIVRSTYQLTYYGTPEGYYAIMDELENTLRDVGFKITNKYSYKNITTNIDHFSLHITSMMEQVYYDMLMEKETIKFNELYPLENDPTLPSGIYFDEETETEIEIKDGLPLYYSDEVSDSEFLP